MRYLESYEYDTNRQNESRADSVEVALRLGDRNAEAAAGGAIHGEVETDVSDLLANVIHFCARAGIAFEQCVDRATGMAEGDLEDGPEAQRDRSRFPDPE